MTNTNTTAALIVTTAAPRADTALRTEVSRYVAACGAAGAFRYIHPADRQNVAQAVAWAVNTELHGGDAADTMRRHADMIATGQSTGWADPVAAALALGAAGRVWTELYGS